MKKRIIIIIILTTAIIAWAANTKVTLMSEVTAVVGADLLYLVDDVAGTPTESKITVENLFDMIDTFAELDAIVADKTLVNTDDGGTWSGNQDFGGADLEIPQASPAVPNADGEIEMDFTDGTLVIQHGSAHAELASATDVVIAKLIRSFNRTFGFPDTMQSEIDNWLFRRIDATEFPHGIVITSITLTVSENTSYTINVENWDDNDTINGANGTIDSVAYTADGTGEKIEDTITYSTIGAGQIIQIDLPTTNVGWINVQILYYEPAA